MKKNQKRLSFVVFVMFFTQFVFASGLNVQLALAEETAKLVNENFNSIANNGLPTGWKASNGAASGTIVVDKPGVTGDKCLKLFTTASDASNAADVRVNIPDQASVFTVEFDYLEDPTAVKNMYIKISDGETFPYAVGVALGKSGISTWDGKKIADGIKPSTWTHVKIETDATKKTYNVYVGDELKTVTPIAYRNDAITKLNKIILTNDTNEKVGLGYIDNLVIYAGSPKAGTAPAQPATSTQPVQAGNGDPRILLPSELELTKKVKQKLADSVALFIGNSNALVKDFEKKVDSTNPSVKPIIKEGRTLVPVRFIAESFGANVGWDAPTSTVSVTMGDKAIKLVLGSKEISVNGTTTQLDVPAQSVNGRTLIPLRALVEALGKKVFWDNRGLIIISNQDNIFNTQTEQSLIDKTVSIFNNTPELNSYDKYSSVFLSSRWYREDGRDNQLGTLDVFKRFSVTDDKWSYISDASQINNMVNLGVAVQSSLNTNIGSANDMKAQLYDGTIAVAPWMTWGATWACMNSPTYVKAVKDTAHKSIDAGVTAFQFDDWEGNAALNALGICFCDNCMRGFTDYLSKNYNADQIKGFGIDNIAGFNYKTHLHDKFGVNTNSDYAAKRQQTPLDPIFLDFQRLSVRNFHVDIKKDLEAYAGRPIIYSNNVTNLYSNLNKPAAMMVEDIFNYSAGETHEATYSLSNIVTGAPFMTGVGKPFLISPLVEHVNVVRQGIPISYALGQHFLVPWDIWLHDNVRYFGTVEEFGDLYHFVRQYKELFDGYEVPAKAGLLVQWSSFNKDQLTKQSTRLFSAGVPFKDLIGNEKLPTYKIDPNKIKGLNYIIAHTPVSSFTTEDQQVIKNSGVQVIAPEQMTDTWLAQNSAVKVNGDSIYTVLRAKPDEADAPKVIHVLNKKEADAQNVLVTINDTDFFGASDMSATLYAPNENPVALTITNAGNGKHEIKIPKLGIWGIIRVQKKWHKHQRTL